MMPGNCWGWRLWLGLLLVLLFTTGPSISQAWAGKAGEGQLIGGVKIPHVETAHCLHMKCSVAVAMHCCLGGSACACITPDGSILVAAEPSLFQPIVLGDVSVSWIGTGIDRPPKAIEEPDASSSKQQGTNKMTKTLIAFSTSLLIFGSLTASALAQDSMGHDMSNMGSASDLPASTDTSLPAICKSAAGEKAAGALPSSPIGHTVDMGEGNMALMAGMDQMHKDMMTGIMAADVDVAFVCGMIPHHQGAIAMAKAELQYGDNEWARQMAQKVIDAQEQEIADMRAWLEQQ
jgi:hypothetical protein